MRLPNFPVIVAQGLGGPRAQWPDGIVAQGLSGPEPLRIGRALFTVVRGYRRVGTADAYCPPYVAHTPVRRGDA